MLSAHHSPSGMVLSESLMPSHGHARFLLNLCSSTLQKSRSNRRVSGKGCRFSSRSISNTGIRAEAAEPAVSSTTVVKTTAVKAVVTVQLTAGGLLSSLSWSAPLDAFADLIGKSLLLGVVSAELDPKTGLEKKPIKAYAGPAKKEGDQVKYDAHFKIEEGFGEVGGVIVTNEHHKEMHLIDIVITGYGNDPINIICNSWVHAKGDSSQKRIFFTNKSFLPSQTPSGLKRLRSEELEALRGDGEGERKSFERIYDYDTYNDLGNPDSSDDLARPVLGGKDHPFPRRCRTGRPRTKKGTYALHGDCLALRN